MAARDHPGWPAVLRHGDIELRPLRVRDAMAWSRLRLGDERWLAPWEPTSPQPWAIRHSARAFLSMQTRLRSHARTGAVLPFAIVNAGGLAGQITVANIVRGALRSGQIGYWITESVAGRGLTTTAVALVVDHCFGYAGLHRVQVDIRPENAPSRRVVEKLGFREEALFKRYLDIDGAFRDHVGYALTVEDCPEGLVRRLSRR
ncbi:MAG: GNAT family N-acetyltransferase [Mycobacteriales bacterium]